MKLTLGWLAISVIQLQNQYAAESAEKQLRQDVTDVLNDVDKRLAVMEAMMIMNHQRAPEPAPSPPTPLMSPYGVDDDASSDPFESDTYGPDEAVMDIPFAPRYDLRDQRQQRD
jgi:hypothetical protein